MRFSIKLKLSLAFAVITLLLVGIAVYGSISVDKLDEANNTMVEGPVKRLQLALDANVAEVNAVRAQQDALLATVASETAGFYKDSNGYLDAMFSNAQDGLAIASAEDKPYWEKLVSLGQTFRQRSADLQALDAKGDRAAADALALGEMRDLASQM